MLVRRIARPLLAAPFVILGVDALRHPEARAPAAKPVVEKMTEQANKQLPVQVPQDPEQWVKINAGVMVGAGALFGLGRLPRLCALLLTGSMVPTTLAGHRFWEHEGASRQTQMIQFLKNLGLIGGLLIAAVDTEGRPSLGWWARRTPWLVRHTASGLRRDTEHALHSAALSVRDNAHTVREKLPV
jgi:uncharacterized membrane protein YphA (DoxX/SURF4 family)